MPKTKEQSFRYRVIDAELRARPWVKTVELQRAIEALLMESVDLRTIQKDLKDMRDDTRLGYFAPVEYDTKRKAYRYTDRDYSILQFGLQASEVSALKFYASCLQLYSEYGVFKDFSNAIQKIINGISLKNTLHKDTDPALIIQTDTAANARGSDLLERIIQAIDEKTNLSFTYQKYTGEKRSQQRIISPYLLKEYKNRWYVLGMSLKDRKIKTFALDRITSLAFAPGQYNRDGGFDPAAYFKHSFGITTPDEPVEEITIKVFGSEIEYLQSLPIHPTQKIIKKTKNYLLISIRVIPSWELFEFLLGKSPNLEIISPVAIKAKLQVLLRQAVSHIK